MGSLGRPMIGAFLGLALATSPLGDSTVPRVLFIGNSYTYFNNLPAIVERFGPIETELIARGGATLQQHWAEGTALGRIRAGRWNYVVLQEQSTLGRALVDGRPRINDPAAFHRAVRLFDREIRAAGARTVLYQTWAARSAPADHQRALDAAFATIGRELGGAVAPVGLAWERVRRERPALELYDPDGSHPSPAGSYLGALVLAETILGTPPTAPPGRVIGPVIRHDGSPGAAMDTLVALDAAAIALLTRVAREAVRDGLPLVEPQPRGSPPAVPPPGRAIDSAGLVGTWIGPLRLYEPDSATAELTVGYRGGTWSATWSVRFPRGQARNTYQVLTFEVRDSVLTFLIADPRWVGPFELHRAVLTSTGLVGIAEIGAPADPPHLRGRWDLTRR